MDDFEQVWEIFKKNRNWLGHVRKDKIKKRIENRQVIFEDNVVITFHISKKNVKFSRDTNVRISKGDCVLHQIGSLEKGKGNGTRVLKRFFDHIGTDVYLGVGDENLTANRFYEKIGMTKVGYVNWSEGRMKGTVYCKKGEVNDR